MLISLTGALYASAAPSEKNIIVVHQYSEEFPHQKMFNDGLAKTLSEEKRCSFILSYEYLKVDKYPNNDAYLKATVEYREIDLWNIYGKYIAAGRIIIFCNDCRY